MSRLRLPLALLALALSQAAPAAVRVWPNLSGVGPCQGTLQDCLSTSAPGDTVLIGADDLLLPDGRTRIDESVVVDRSLTLAAADGIEAVFAPGRWILVDPPGPGPVDIVLRRLAVVDGHVRVRHSGAGAGSYRLEELWLSGNDRQGYSACAISFVDEGAGRPHFILADSHLDLRVPGGLSNGVCLYGTGGDWQADVFRNRVQIERSAALSGISVFADASGHVAVAGNQVVGDGFARGIAYQAQAPIAGRSLDIDNNAVSGQRSGVGAGEFALSANLDQVAARVRNNTLAWNSRGMLLIASGGSTRVANNLVAHNAVSGFELVGAGIENRHNLVHGNGFDAYLPGAGTVTGAPLLGGPRDLRPRPGSPALNSGSTADAPLLLGLGFDIDGERRIAGGAVDIGAYERNGDLAVAHRANDSNLSGHQSLLDSFPEPIGGGAERLLATGHRRGGSSPERSHNLGVYLGAGTQHFVFHENLAPMSAGRRFSVMAPLGGHFAFAHQTAPATIFGEYSRLDDSELDNRPGAIALLTHNWNPGGVGGTYHNRRVGLAYSGARWHVRNQDLADMPVGIGFNVVVATLGSPNAFMRKLGAAAGALAIPHRLLDGNPCAAPQVGRVDDPFDALVVANDVPLTVEFRPGAGGGPGRWHIVAEGSGTPTFPANAAFNVLIPGAQAARCRDDAIFAHRFEP